jgi:TatD DNase family protein
MVVNGAAEADWPQVLRLAQTYPMVIPSFGYHPWYVGERSRDWQAHLRGFLQSVPCAVGEIGLDRWRPGLAYGGQEEVFQTQLRLAAEHDLPVSIHCLQAWGRLLELLRAGPRPRRGFLLHSFGGPRELVAPLSELGAYFGFPGYFLHARKARQRDTFQHVPQDRLLVETDAPDQPLPAALDLAPLIDGAIIRDHFVTFAGADTKRPVNHPANLACVYHGLAALLGLSLAELTAKVAANFQRLFGGF